MSVLEQRLPKYRYDQRHAPQANTFGLGCCDHFGIPARDPELAGKFVEQILGGVEFFRAGYSEEDRAKGKMRHIFYHIGKTLLEVVEQEDGVSYPDVTNPEHRNMNPHFAWETTVQGVVDFAKHLEAEGIPFAGPRRHVDVSAVSVYFRDIDGNILEVTTWEDFPEGLIAPRKAGEKLADWAELSHHWRPH